METTNNTCEFSTAFLNIAKTTWSHPVVFGFRSLFYFVSHSETSFEKLDDVPNYTDEAIPFIMFFVALEYLILRSRSRVRSRGKDILEPRFNDVIASISAGLISIIPTLVTGSTELFIYQYTYENWRLIEMPWDSVWTWWFGFLAVEFGFYWIHRTAHEVNMFWTGHQTHHTSEHYNMSTALRVSPIQRYQRVVFNLPLALVMPPSVIAVHVHLNQIYQIWIHTETIGNLGPLEYILNTPSHHRVHHGRNRYCIDKNYGGTLIIWDRLFGTFEPESEEVVYGLVHPLNSWDALTIQFGHLQYMVKTAWKIEGFTNKLCVVLKGPGWEPGKPRTGLIEDIPDVHAPQPKYDKQVPLLLNVYCVLHLALTIVEYKFVKLYINLIDPVGLVLVALYLTVSLSSFGFIMENKWYAAHIELIRCILHLVADVVLTSSTELTYLLYIPRSIYLLSACIWALSLFKGLDVSNKKTDKIS